MAAVHPFVEIPGYRIERELGRGGMAAVYLAEQLSLRRLVALKVLEPRMAAEPGFTERFLREGRIAAGLRHRHIVAVHDVGVHEARVYLAMEYLPRGSIAPLAGEMDLAEALRCVREIAGALDAAHRQGIVHRDVKPENILRHEDGAFLLSDFGIARVLGSVSVLTREGSTVGTPAYMSPEQWRDDPVDGRSDLYGLGVVLYQLLTGDLPYRGSDGWSLGLQHMSAPLPELPARHRRAQGLLDVLLAKAPDDRPPTGADVARMAELVERDLDQQAVLDTTPPPSRVAARMVRAAAPEALASLFRTVPPPRRPWPWRWLAAAGAALALALATPFAVQVVRRDPVAAPGADPPVDAAQADATPMLAVLPCENWLADPQRANLGDSLAQQIAHRLSRLDGLAVVGSVSSFALRDEKLTVQELGRRLGADLLLGCSLRDSNGVLRIGAELTDARTNVQRWSVQLERSPDAMLDTVDEISVGIAERVLANLVGTERAALLAHDTGSAEALQLYFEAIALAESWTAEGLAAADAKLARVLELDPDFALGHFALANLWMNRMQIENLAPARVLPLMEQALAEALRLDPDLGPAYALRCHAHWFRYQWDQARDDCRRAMVLAPNSDRVNMLVGQYEVSFGDRRRGIEHMQRFRELEPEMPFAWLNLAVAYAWSGQPERADAESLAMLARFPDDPLTHIARGWVLIEAGRCAEAMAAWQRAADVESNLEWLGWAAGASACAGSRREAERLRDQILQAIRDGRYIARAILVYAEAQLGNTDAAFRHIETGHAEYDFGLTQMLGGEARMLGPLRGDPRYAQWRARYGFPPRE